MWIFTHPDTWTRTDAPEWVDGDDDTAYMKRLGYIFADRAYGTDLVDWFGLWTLWQANDPNATFQYALILSMPNDQITHVWLPTIPDLMAYMRLYGHIGRDAVKQYDLEAYYELIKRLFRALHGHDAGLSCRVCDPAGFEKGQRRGTIHTVERGKG